MGEVKKTEYIGGLPVDNLTYQDIVLDIYKCLATDKKMLITSVNPQIALQVYQYPEVKAYLERATHRIADGIGVVKVSKLLGGNIRERITGIDVMERSLKVADNSGCRIFLYGAKKNVVKQAALNIQKKYPNIVIAGILHGYTTEKVEDVINKINQTNSTFLFVALGSPRQEVFLERYVEQLNPKIFLDVGGTFDVFAKVVKRAPKFYLDHNLEWLYRSISMHRYDRLLQIPKYLWMCLDFHFKQLEKQKTKNLM